MDQAGSMAYKNASERPTIIFLHILKTAGTTLNIILENHFTPENSFSTFPNHMHPDGSIEGFRALSNSEKQRIDLLTGHMGFGLHRDLPRPAVYITLLRNPIDRVISRYYQEKHDPYSHLHHAINSGMNLPEYARFYAEAAEMDNLQTRMIAGNWNKRGFGPCTTKMLATAKSNLQKRFVVCGLTERFDAFYLLLTHTFGWPPIYYRSHNVSSNRRRADSLPPDTVAAIGHYNQYDLELYDFARELFRAQTKQFGPLFGLRARAYEVRNRIDPTLREVRAFSLRVYLRERLR